MRCQNLRRDMRVALACIGCLCGCCLLTNATAQPQFYNGVVTHVTDGDTVTIRLDSGEYKKIRFYGVDSPETKWPYKWPAQPFSGAAKQFIHDLLHGKTVTIRLIGERTGEREVGEVFVEGFSASRELLRQGLAWWNKKYAPLDLDLKRLEFEAKTQAKGLWRRGEAVPPWQYRRSYR